MGAQGVNPVNCTSVPSRAAPPFAWWTGRRVGPPGSPAAAPMGGVNRLLFLKAGGSSRTATTGQIAEVEQKVDLFHF